MTMETSPCHSAPFCARCSYTKLMHGRLGGAFSNFIAPGSKEARELTKVINTSDLNSARIEQAPLWAAIRLAKARLIQALEAEPAMKQFHITVALAALKGIGDS